jgi:hypothetical protein
VPPLFPMPATFSAHLTLLDLAILIKYGVYYRTVNRLRQKVYNAQIVGVHLSFTVSYVYDLGTILNRPLTEPLLGCELKIAGAVAERSDICQAV